jgi:signal transduction histidine kinase/DNA-binding NarL/FixJ family response regulator
MDRRAGAFFRFLAATLLLAIMPATVFAQEDLLDLTEAEKEFIRRHPVIRVGIDAAFAPFEFLDGQGNYAGIAPDYLALIGARTGLRFEPARDVPYGEAQKKVRAHELDLLPSLGWTAEREKTFLLSQPYYEYKLALVTREGRSIEGADDIRGRRLAVQKDTSNAEFALSSLGAVPSFHGSENDALLAVADGRETAMLGYLPTVLYAIRDLGLSNLDYITLDADDNGVFHMGVRNDWPELRGILDKAFAAITPIEKAEIQSHWVRVDDSMTKRLIPILAAIVGLSLLVMLVLQTMVRQRTKDLQKQTRLAMEASRAKSTFLARMSHEIRTPMNAIIGLSEVALREHGTPKALECIMGIKSAGTDLIAIINDILDFSKIESGNLSVFPAPYETASFLNDVLTVIHVKLAETPLELILDISPDIPGQMIGDAGRIKQILLNLLSNAVKYTKKGFVKFSAFGEPTGKDTIRLSFIVEDSGIGISQENMAKLFGEFMRIDEKRNSRIEGTGLGLSIARSLCRIMGGDITAQSEYGKGSAFTATLTQTVADWKPIGKTSDITTTRVKMQRITFTAPEAEVLVVDDFPSNLLVAEGLLAPYGMRVFTCADGREAVAWVRERSFDLVLMDHMMPEMDGVEATLAIRGLDEEYGRTMPIVALTANAVAGMREMFLENGFNDFLAKPIETARLDAVLKEWIPADKQREAPEDDEKAQQEPALPEIVGVNVTAGLARIGGSPRRYLELLEMFRRDVAAAFPALEREPDDPAVLRSFTTQVHALKSALANIGANDLSHAAALLEKAGREANTSIVRDTLPPFREELTALMAQITEFSASFHAANGEEGIDPAMKGVLARLREVLAAKDFAAIDAVLAQAQSLPVAGKVREAVSEIADFILMSDFRKAEDAIGKLLGTE